jgi:hypothetical protein
MFLGCKQARQPYGCLGLTTIPATLSSTVAQVMNP